MDRRQLKVWPGIWPIEKDSTIKSFLYKYTGSVRLYLRVKSKVQDNRHHTLPVVVERVRKHEHVSHLDMIDSSMTLHHAWEYLQNVSHPFQNPSSLRITSVCLVCSLAWCSVWQCLFPYSVLIIWNVTGHKYNHCSQICFGSFRGGVMKNEHSGVQKRDTYVDVCYVLQKQLDSGPLSKPLPKTLSKMLSSFWNDFWANSWREHRLLEGN